MSPPVRDPRAGQEAPAAPRKIALVGLRGSGKSSVGALLALQLRRSFVDLDRELERAWAREHERLSAGEVLAREGEPVFRALESRVLFEALAAPEPLVIACGGGVVTGEENRRRLRAEAWVIWLQAPVDELARRLRGDTTFRPPLSGAGTIEELGALGEQRRVWYEEVAHLVFRTEGLTPEQVARVVGSGLGGLGA